MKFWRNDAKLFICHKILGESSRRMVLEIVLYRFLDLGSDKFNNVSLITKSLTLKEESSNSKLY